MIGYTTWSVVAFEVPTAAKWNLLGGNDAVFNTALNTITGGITVSPTSGHVGYQNSTRRVATNVTATSDTVLDTVSDLSIAVEAGKTYKFKARLFCTSNTSGGIKFSVDGTCTATAITGEICIWDGSSTQSMTRITALGTSGGVTATANGFCLIEGTITVNAAGNLVIKFAQNASNVNASTLLLGSTFSIEECLN